MKSVRNSFAAIAIAMVLLLANSCSTQASEPKELADKFLNELLTGDAEKAIELYFKHEIKEMLGAQLQATLAQMRAYSEAFGGYQELELLHDEKLSSRLQRMVYIAHTPIVPIAFELLVYRNDSEWMVTTFRFDTEMKYIFPAK